MEINEDKDADVKQQSAGGQVSEDSYRQVMQATHNSRLTCPQPANPSLIYIQPHIQCMCGGSNRVKQESRVHLKGCMYMCTVLGISSKAKG